MDALKSFIRHIPDFPKPGITFYDVTTLFQDPKGLRAALDAMEKYVKSVGADKIVAIESRGFVVGAAVADRLGLPLVLVRKPGKLPFESISEEYTLEYGTGTLEMHIDAIKPGDKVVIVDDLIATGGTLAAAASLVKRLDGVVVGISAVIALSFLPYEKALADYDVNYLIAYDSE
jgi:adenine phosphoribosyltransferase